MKSSKKGKKPDTNKLGVPAHLHTTHQRLYHGLNLGFRYSTDRKRDWHSNDVEVQRMVVRSISSFLDSISPDTWHMPIVKDSIADVVIAISGILQSPNETVVALGSEVTVKLMKTMPTSMLRPHFGQLSHSLSPLLSNHESQVAVVIATSLNMIVSNLGVKKEKEVWVILKKHDAVTQITGNLRTFSETVKPIEYFVEMASLLSSIMQLWPPSRYPVWNDTKLMEVTEILCSKPEATVKVAVLQLYSALALCANGAQKLLENGKVLIQRIEQCMDRSQPHTVRILAFKVARYLMATKKLCSEVLNLACEPVVKSIIIGLTISSLSPGEFSSEEESLMLEACHLALITWWPGKHHDLFWRFRVDKLLAHLLICNYQKHYPHKQSLSVEELIAVARDCLSAYYLSNKRPFVWEMIGGLSAQCKEDFRPDNDHSLRFVVATACLAFVDSIGRDRLLRQADRAYTLRSVSAAKSTLMMMYSPCKYIASEASLLLLEALRFDGEEYLKQLLHALDFVFSSDMSRMPDKFQILISLMGLTCYSGLPRFYKEVVRNGGTKTLLGFVKWWLDNASHTDKVCLSSHLRVTAMERTCCRIDADDWEGNEIPLLLVFWSLAELINCHRMEECQLDIFGEQKIYKKEQFIQDILQIAVETTSVGLRWYISYLLSFFGFYGFPSKLGKSIASFHEKDFGDIHLVFRDGHSLIAHKVVLLIRCPSLLPPGYSSDGEKLSRFNNSSAKQVGEKGRTKEVTLSAQVDQEAISMLLDFIYSGYLQAEGAIVRKLRMLAKYCNIKPLLQLLCRKRPKWEALMPNFDLTAALGPAGHEFSDIVLESKSTEITGWNCSFCSLSMPHIHAHRAIISSSCDYIRALFYSGMQESRSESLKVPVSWEALHKLVIWLYSYAMPKPVSGCLWANMDVQQKISELQPLIELCWLSEFWFLDDVLKECSTLITSSLDSPVLAIKVIELAANFSQWELVGVAANKAAPAYRSLHNSGAFDVLDDALVEIIRLASVQLSQEAL